MVLPSLVIMGSPLVMPAPWNPWVGLDQRLMDRIGGQEQAGDGNSLALYCNVL